FFFQAEDGIRDFHVTGVQTCALPISWPRWLSPTGTRRAGFRRATPSADCPPPSRPWRPASRAWPNRCAATPGPAGDPAAGNPGRAEERRGGRGGRCGREAERWEKPPG